MFLSSQGEDYSLMEKVATLGKSNSNPFIAPSTIKTHIDPYERDFYAEL